MATPAPEVKKVRVSFAIPEAVDKATEWCATMEGRQKSDIMTEALRFYLESKGYHPDQLPIPKQP